MTTDTGLLERSADELVLPASETREIQAALKSLCPQWNLARVRIERFLTGGYSNRNYRIAYDQQRFVLRLPGAATRTDFVTEHVRLLNLQRAFDSPPPASLAEETAEQPALEMTLAETVAATQDHGWLLTRWVEQPVLASVSEVSGARLGRYLAALHQRLNAQPLAGADTVGLTAGTSADALIAAIMADLCLLYPDPASQHKLRDHLARSAQECSPACLSHIDLNPWNLLLDGSAGRDLWVTLDWETLAFAPPLFDLVVLCDGYALNSGYSSERASALATEALSAYNSRTQRNYSQHELERMRTLFRWREYAWAAARLEQGSLRAAVRDDVLAQRRDYARLLAGQASGLGVELSGA